MAAHNVNKALLYACLSGHVTLRDSCHQRVMRG